MTHAALNIPPPRLQTELRIERRRDTTSGCPSVARVRNGIPAVADRSARRLLQDHRYIRRRVPQDHIGDTIHAMAVALSTVAPIYGPATDGKVGARLTASEVDELLLRT